MMIFFGTIERRRVCHGSWCVLVVAAILLHATNLQAANTPWSGRKGGIAGCRGDTFICNDGSASASKKSCTATMGGAMGLMGGASQSMAPTADEECLCRSGSFCTGPRGGQFCYTDSGAKSYLRK
ncbi:hypothetical protein GGE07_005635 [Sinorhizobium terangae]|nr:hypothetical protein [Sinorhizobium terangae]